MKRCLCSLLALSFTVHPEVTAPPGFTPFIQSVDNGSEESDPIFQSEINEIRGYPSTDTLAAVVSDNASRIAGFTSESASVPDVDLRGLNGIAVSGTITGTPGGQYAISQPGINDIDEATLPARNIISYSRFLYLIEPGANVYRWETTGAGTVSGTGRALWIARGAIVGAISNTTTTLSDTIAFTTDGTVSGAFTNAGTVRAGEVALDIEDNGSLGAIVNRGTLSGGQYALRNTGTVGSLTNSGTITGEPVHKIV